MFNCCQGNVVWRSQGLYLVSWFLNPFSSILNHSLLFFSWFYIKYMYIFCNYFGFVLHLPQYFQIYVARFCHWTALALFWRGGVWLVQLLVRRQFVVERVSGAQWRQCIVHVCISRPSSADLALRRQQRQHGVLPSEIVLRLEKFNYFAHLCTYIY